MTPSHDVRVTQRVPLEEVETLLSGGARAAVAFAGADGPECLPVVLRRGDDGMRFGVRFEALMLGAPPTRVTLVVDDGTFWFELRAAVWRGSAVPETTAAIDGMDVGGLRWFQLESSSVIAWDYGLLHEEPA
jgi:hypothetical protein